MLARPQGVSGVSQFTGRDSASSVVSVPLHLRVPGLEGAVHGAESTDDATVLPRDRAGVADEDQQGHPLQVSLLSVRESAKGRQTSVPMTAQYDR